MELNIPDDEMLEFFTQYTERKEFVEKLYNGEVTEEEVPLMYRDYVLAKVEERRQADEAALEEEATAEDIFEALGGIL